jgi:hypothetical protein
VKTSRQSFIKGSLAVVGTSVAGIGCGSDDDDDGGSTSACSSTIGSNHGHVLMVNQADVDAAADKSYDITGSAAHPHTVAVTAADFAKLAGGESVMLTSSTDASHSHSVTIMCG